MKTDPTGSAFSLQRGARALAAAVFMTLFVGLAMGATRTSSQSRTQTPSPSTRRASATATTSVRHRVIKGENLYRIALAYRVPLADLCRANGIKDSNQVTEGQVLFVPVMRSAVPALPSAAAPAPSSAAARRQPSATMNASHAGSSSRPQLIKTANRTVISNIDEPEHDTAETESDEIPAGEGSPSGISFSLVPSEEPFSWPVQSGIVRSSFGMRHGRQHAGIDICAPTGSPIYAARDGVVTYSGHKFRGYGNVVMVDHGDGFSSVYAHNVSNLVREGDRVVRGQIIARVGATGNATGAHCHFEIRNDNVSVDPRGYLADSPQNDVIFAGGLPPALTPSPRQAAIPQPDLIP